MNQIAIQVMLAIASWMGIALGWLPGHSKKNRISGPLGFIIRNVVGLPLMLVPWIVMPLLAQPHLSGSLQTGTFVIGILLLVIFVLLEIWAMPFIAPAAKKGGDEINPGFLVVKGPYRWVRHSQYLGGVLGIIGWALLRCGLYSILLSPIGYLLFRFEAYLEESRVLEPKFGDEFRRFKKQVPTAILGRIGIIVLVVAYLAFVSLVILGKVIAG